MNSEGTETSPGTVPADLLARVRAGDEAAARTLVERLYPILARIVHANLPRRDDPDDLMQETFGKLFSRLDQYRGDVPFERWAGRIALNTCLDRLRRQQVRPEVRWTDLDSTARSALEDVAEETARPEPDATGALALLETLLAALPAPDAWLLRQLELEQRSIADICAETGWNSGVTRIRAFRARRRLQAQFQKLERQRP